MVDVSVTKGNLSILQIAYEAGKEFEKSELGTLCLTPFGEKIISIVRENPNNIAEFEKEFVLMFQCAKQIPHELIAFCMYHLRLDNVRIFIENYRSVELRKNNWNADGPSSDILSAYVEPWENFELFYE